MEKRVYILIGIFVLMFLFTNSVSAACYSDPYLQCSLLPKVGYVCGTVYGPECLWNSGTYTCSNAAGASCTTLDYTQCTSINVGCSWFGAVPCTTEICCDNGEVADTNYVCETDSEYYCAGEEIKLRVKYKYCDGITASSCNGIWGGWETIPHSVFCDLHEDTYCVNGEQDCVVDSGRCSDNLDNDGDGAIDEADGDCAGILCPPDTYLENGYCKPFCGNGIIDSGEECDNTAWLEQFVNPYVINSDNGNHVLFTTDSETIFCQDRGYNKVFGGVGTVPVTLGNPDPFRVVACDPSGACPTGATIPVAGTGSKNGLWYQVTYNNYIDEITCSYWAASKPGTNGDVCTAIYDSSCTYCSYTCTEETVLGSHCGDGTCDAGYETCATCLTDCPCGGNEECVNGVCKIPNIFWSLDGSAEISPLPTQANPLEINIGDVIYLIVENSGFPQGPIPFSVYEDDPKTDDEIRGGKSQYIQGTVDASGKAVATWTITEADLIAASSDLLDQESSIYDDFEFYFIAGTSVTGEHKSGIFYTEHFCTPDCVGKECGDDGCGGVCNGVGDGDTAVCNEPYGTCSVSGTKTCTGTTFGACEGTTDPRIANCAAPIECGSDGCGGDCYGIGDGGSTACIVLYGNCEEWGLKECSGTTFGACEGTTDPRIANCAAPIECGSDGCGDVCGTCVGETCINGICSSTYWSLDGSAEISPLPTQANPLEINIGDIIYLIVENSGYATGAIDFSIYEEDNSIIPPDIGDDTITALQGTVTDGKAVATWTITEADLDNAWGFLGEENSLYDDFEFYFKAGNSEEFESGIFYTEHLEPIIPPNLYWGDDDEETHPNPFSAAGIPYNIKAIAKNIGSPGSIVTFNIEERDFIPDADDHMWTASSVVDANGKAVLIWEINSNNLTEAKNGPNENSVNDEMEFYFEVEGETSEDLLFTYDIDWCPITFCSQYDSFPNPQPSCDGDSCEVNKTFTDCEEGDTCLCEWNGSNCNREDYPEPNINTNVCVWCIEGGFGAWCDMPEETNDYCNTTGTECGVGASITNSLYCDALDFTIGSCTYLTDDSGDPDGCEDDGYLTYTWGAQWSWNDVANFFAPPDPDPDGDDFLEDPLGTWRYDPTLLSVDCNAKGGTSSAICPAQIELPFFGTWGIIVTIALIILIYVALNLKKHKPKKRKKK